MAMKKTGLILSLSFLFVLLLSFNPGGTVKLVNADEQKTWCVAKPSTDEITLQDNINYVCTQGICDILSINNGPCFNPDTLMNHASVAMNLYYQSRGRNYGTCSFNESGLIVLSDPSYDDCVYGFKE